MAQLDDKVALVTGGAHGFGRVLALTLARAGADVAIADMGRSRQSSQFAVAPDLDQIDGVVKEVEALGRRAIGLSTDVRKGDDCRRMAEKTIEALGRWTSSAPTRGRSWTTCVRPGSCRRRTGT